MIGRFGHIIARVFIGLAGLGCAAAVNGCDRRASQADPPSYRPEDPTGLFADGSSARPLVDGVVPRPAEQSPGMPYCVVDSPNPAHHEPLATTARIPFPVTDVVLARGQERFDIYCVACHGRTGTGDGIIVQRGFSHPPSFYSQRLLQAPDAHFYDVITNGLGAMFSYNDRIVPDDRWAIVAYIRTLQQAARQAPPANRPVSFGGPGGAAPQSPASTAPASAGPTATGGKP